MKHRSIALSAALAAAGALIPGGAHAALGAKFGEYKLSGTNQHLSLVLPAGVYDITSIGTYVYDNGVNPPLRADAECSEPSPRSDAWKDPVDVVVDGFGLKSVVSGWHPHRYDVNGQYFTKGGNPTLTSDPSDDLLDVYVNGKPVHWVPTYPTASDGGRIVGGCNTTTHQYDTVVESDGKTPTTLNVFDLNYADNGDVPNLGAGNGPGLTIQIGRLAG